MMSCLLATQTEVVSDLIIDVWTITAKSVCPGLAKEWVDCVLRINASLVVSDALLLYKLSELALRLLETLPENDRITYFSSLKPLEATLENQSQILTLFSQFPFTIYSSMSSGETFIATLNSVLRVAESHISQLKELYETVSSMDAKCDVCVAMIPAVQSAARIVDYFLAKPESQQSEISDPLSSMFRSLIFMVKFIFEAVENKAETGQTRNLAKILKSADVAIEFLTTTIAWIIQRKIEIPITEALSALEKWAVAPIPLGLCGLRSVGALFVRLAKMKTHDQAALTPLKPIFMTLKFHLFSTSGTLQSYLLHCFNSMISAHDGLKMLIQDQQEMASLVSDVDRINGELSKGVQREGIEKSLVSSIFQSLPTLYKDNQVELLKSLDDFTNSPILELRALSSVTNSANTSDVSDLASKTQSEKENSKDVSLDQYLHCMSIVKDLNEVFNGNLSTKLGSGQGVLGLGLSKEEVRILREKLDELKGMLRVSV
ncbi:hypothetical protein BKA69DRAFT_1085338 [Paraphysoderma sedebokerense]|nr:hypothetical protein BKA69DRAFT_1085338 [Paraphysoderma sedebokerense]